MKNPAAFFTKRAAVGAVLACVLAGALAPASAFAVTAAEKQAEAQEALSQLNSMQQVLDKTSAAYDEALFAQTQAEADRDAAQGRIDELAVRIADVQDRLGQRAASMYRSGSTSMLDLLLGATTFQEFATNWDLLTKINENDADLIDEERSLKAEAEEQRQLYAEQADLATQKAQEAADAQAQAQSTVAEMQAVYDSLSAEAQQMLEEERAAQAAAEAARAEATVAQSAAQGSSDGTSAPVTPSPVGGEDENRDEGPSRAYEGGSDTVSRAWACLGAPYGWGAVGPYSYDCSGLVSYCISGSHVRIGSTLTFMGWRQVSDPQPGDVCTDEGHCGIYIGGGQMIHAATYGVGVVVGPVQSGMIIVRP